MKTIKVYISKYALGNEIEEVEARIVDASDGTSIVDKRNRYFYGTEWHRTEEAAKKQVREMINRKLKSLEKQKVKLLEAAQKYGLNL